jgi:hypothetical protein
MWQVKAKLKAEDCTGKRLSAKHDEYVDQVRLMK